MLWGNFGLKQKWFYCLHCSVYYGFVHIVCKRCMCV